jgi:hypothetical protein
LAIRSDSRQMGRFGAVYGADFAGFGAQASNVGSCNF